MDDVRPADLYTRRTALTLVAAAIPAFGQQPQGAKMANPVVHFEIGCKDRAKTARFFTDLFGWHVQDGPAATIDTGGIPGHITSLGHEPQHYTIFYVEVDDVQAYLDKATALGGKTLVPPIKIPTGMFAWFSDIEGNTIGLLKKN
jgi:predicted enzyme related to lactoylglutathione lyase